jgi:polysaccharide biosynthesis protein PslH
MVFEMAIKGTRISTQKFSIFAQTHIPPRPTITRANFIKQEPMSVNSLNHERILLVSPTPPYPPDNGGRQRTYFLWKALSEIAPVDVILCDDISWDSSVTASIPASQNFLGRFPWRSRTHSLCRHIKKSTLSFKVERLLRPAFPRDWDYEAEVERLVRVTFPRDWDYEADRDVKRSLSEVLGRNQYFLAVGRYLKPIVKTGLVGRMPCLLDIDDVDFDIFVQRAQDITLPRWQRLLYSAQSSQIKAALRRWLPQFNGLWVTKASDTRYSVTRNAAILPNIPYHVPVFPSSLNGSSSASPIILTVGSLSYGPNQEGVDRFIREGWPKVRAACPTAEYWLAGRNDPAFARAWQAVSGVRVLGFVDDITAVYDASWFTLCPLWTGAGTNIKVLESLAFGRTCVATVIGHRGFEDHLQSGDSLLVGTNAEDLAENCIRLINDQARRLALAKRGREVVGREFTYEKFADIVHREVERAIGERVRLRGLCSNDQSERVHG